MSSGNKRSDALKRLSPLRNDARSKSEPESGAAESATSSTSEDLLDKILKAASLGFTAGAGFVAAGGFEQVNVMMRSQQEKQTLANYTLQTCLEVRDAMKSETGVDLIEIRISPRLLYVLILAAVAPGALRKLLGSRSVKQFAEDEESLESILGDTGHDVGSLRDSVWAEARVKEANEQLAKQLDKETADKLAHDLQSRLSHAWRFAPYDVFISHANKDEPIPSNLYELLKARSFKVHSCSIFHSEKSIKAGDRWEEVIYRSAVLSRLMVLILSENARLSDYVKKEVRTSIQWRNKIFPVVLPGTWYEQQIGIEFCALKNTTADLSIAADKIFEILDEIPIR